MLPGWIKVKIIANVTRIPNDYLPSARLVQAVRTILIFSIRPVPIIPLPAPVPGIAAIVRPLSGTYPAGVDAFGSPVSRLAGNALLC